MIPLASRGVCVDESFTGDFIVTWRFILSLLFVISSNRAVFRGEFRPLEVNKQPLLFELELFEGFLNFKGQNATVSESKLVFCSFVM